MGDAESVRKNGPMVLLLAVLAFLGIRSFTPDSAAPSAERAKSREERPVGEARNEPSGAEYIPSSAAERLLQRLSGYQDAGSASDFKSAIESWKKALPDLTDARFLIACVPDPVDSGTGDRFDTLIDSIQRAAETQQYVLDRHYYPWPNLKGPGKGVRADSVEVTAGETRPAQRMGKTQVPWSLRIESLSETRPWTRLPGVLLLRAPDEAPCKSANGAKLLLVLLVGETATAGLHKEAFMASMHLVKCSREYQQSGRVNVVGPCFSGSQVSLEKAIRQWVLDEKKPPALAANRAVKVASPPPHFHIVSGSATVIDRNRLQTICDQAEAKVTFQATVVPEPKVIDALLDYLNLRSREPNGGFTYQKDFAILYESNTTFGRQTIHPLHEMCALSDKGGPTFFPFPLHISEVRAAYEKTTGPTKSGALRLPSFGSMLPLRLHRTNDPRETEPALAPDMTAVTTERTLASMLDAIAHERFRHVLILTTDVKDMLFLASVVRAHCPESRLIFSDTDLLLSHPDFSADLRGSIIGSTYPLYLGNQRWSFPYNGRVEQRIFPGPREQGCFNAVIALLNSGDTCDLLEYGPPFPKLNVKPSPRVPPVWISLVGEGGLYPLTAVPPSDEPPYGGYVFSPEGPAQIPDGPVTEPTPVRSGLWVALVLGMVLLLCYVGWTHGYVVWKQLRNEQERKGDGGSWEMLNLFWPRHCAEAQSYNCRLRQRLYVFVCLTSVLAVAAYLTFVWLIPSWHHLLRHGSLPVDDSGLGWIMPCVFLGLVSMFLACMVLRVLLFPMLPALGWIGRIARNPPRFRWQAIRRLPNSLWQAIKRFPSALWKNVKQIPRSLWNTIKAIGRFIGRLLGWIWGSRRFWRLYLIGFSLVIIMTLYFLQQNKPFQMPKMAELLLFSERATRLASGVTPVVPIVVLGMAFFCWGFFQLKRLYLLEKHDVKNPFPGQPSLFNEVNKYNDEIRDLLKNPLAAFRTWGAFIAWVLWFYIFSRLYSHFVPTVEGVVTESLVLLALAVLAMLIVYGWLHLRKAWESARRLLRAITLLPLEKAFTRIPSAITDMFGPNLTSERPGRQGHLAYRQEQHRLLATEYHDVAVDLRIAVDLSAWEMAKLASALPKPIAADWEPATPEGLSVTAKACLRVLARIWSNPARSEKLLKTPPNDAVGRWLTRAEDFVALEATVYLSQFFVQLRNMALYLTLAPLLLLLALTSYPFQPQRWLVLLAVVLIGLVTLSVIWMAIQVERNELLSRIAKTTPNQINFHWSFLSHLGLYAIPLLGVLVAMSSDLSDLVHAWVDPLLQVLK